jgi:hypothetical protein
MRPTNDGGLRLALERLKWALAVPMQHHDDDWDGRLSRALTFLQSAWDGHAARTETGFAQVIDPSLLPFTELSQRLSELRHEHSALTDRLVALRGELEKPRPAYRSCQDEGGQALSAALENPSRSGRSLGTICRRTRQLLAAMERHLSAEQGLDLHESSQPSEAMD